jgi:hypothetical protein
MSDGRVQAVFGLVSAVGFTFGVLLLSSVPVGGEGSSDAEIRDFYQSAGDRRQVIVGFYLLIISLAFFVPLLSAVYVRSRAAEGSDGSHSLAALILGVTFVALAAAGAAALASVAGAISLGGEPDELPDTGVARFLGHLGYALLLVGAAIAAAGMMFAFSWVGRLHRWLPAWTTWYGFGAALILLAAITFVPIVAIPLWILVFAILLFTGRLGGGNMGGVL